MPARDGAETGQYLTEHPDIAKIPYRRRRQMAKVMANSAVITERGSRAGAANSPLIIFADDADPSTRRIDCHDGLLQLPVRCNGTRVFVPAKQKGGIEHKIRRVARRPPQRLFADDTLSARWSASPSRQRSALSRAANAKARAPAVRRRGAEGGSITARGCPTVFDCSDGMTIVREFPAR